MGARRGTRRYKTGLARPYCRLPGKVANFLDYVGRLSENRRVTAYRQFLLMTELPPQPEPSESRFTVVRLHAKGGLGQVSLARDEKLKRRVALKEIRPDKRANPEIRRRFLAEAEITGQLEHPGIVPIYDLDEGNDGEVRYAMRFVEGRTLGDAVREYYQDPSPLAFRGLLQRFVNVCETIAYAHSQGVIHRDLKPANVLLGDYGETLVVDWGLAKRLADSPAKSTPVTIPSIATTSALDETTDYVETPADDNSLTLAGQVLGTPAYMAPEQAKGDVAAIGVPADVYGLGAILYEILTGRHPSQGRNPQEAILAITQGKHERPSELRKGVPRALEAICLKAMAPQRRDRYGGALDLARDIECWLVDEPVSAYQEPIWNRFARWRRRYRTPLIAVTVLCTTALIVGGIGGALALRERERTRALGRVDAVREAAPASVPFLLSTLPREVPLRAAGPSAPATRAWPASTKCEYSA